MEKDLKWIKKHYGEQMMHLCRELFPKILETEGLLPKLLADHFPNNNRYLAADIKESNAMDDFKGYIFSLIDVEKNSQIIESKTAIELMNDAGYILYPECQTEEDIQSFRKWWQLDEELCTFRGGRLNSCRVWFAVKKNAGEILRENFQNPARQDEYGTSVISIQFTRNGTSRTLSIKNRYNHTVNNPDNTFNSDLDNITSGLTEAFVRDYGIRDECYDRHRTNFELEDYVCVNGMFYHYNLEINNIYYCEGGVVINNFVVKQLPQHQMLIDYFVVDFNKKTISILDNSIGDSFCDSVGEIKQMSFENGILKICEVDGNKIEIGVSSRNEIVSFKNKKLQRIDDNFLVYNKKLKELDLPELESMGANCFYKNTSIMNLNLPKLESMRSNCFSFNSAMKELDLPELESIGNSCFYWNNAIVELSLPKLRSMGHACFGINTPIAELNLPKLESMGNNCFGSNNAMTELDLPELKSMGDSCFFSNTSIMNLNLLELESMGDSCFFNNKSIMNLNLPKLESMGDSCFFNNKSIMNLNLPELESVGNNCFYWNNAIVKLSLPKLRSVGYGCFCINAIISELNLPKLESMGNNCFSSNNAVTELDLPELKSMDDYCFYNSRKIMNLNLPKLESMGNNCFSSNNAVTELDLPELEKMGSNCFYNSRRIKNLNLPKLKSMGNDCFGSEKKLVKKKYSIFDGIKNLE